jgi:hypothetical protein
MLLTKGYINQLCGEAPTHLRMRVLVHTTDLDGVAVALTNTQPKAAIIAPYHSDQDARKLQDRLEMQPQRFVILGINVDSYNAVVWVPSRFS